MKRVGQWFFFVLCALLFVLFRFRAHSTSHSLETFHATKPALPSPSVHTGLSLLVDRVYLGETALGMPFYLDVRLFNLKGSSAAELIAWYLDTLDGPCEEVYISEQRKVYIRRGERNPTRTDSTHGFAALQGERALFLDCYEQGDDLYVCTAEAPLETFLQHEPFLRSLCHPAGAGLLGGPN